MLNVLSMKHVYVIVMCAQTVRLIVLAIRNVVEKLHAHVIHRVAETVRLIVLAI